MELSGFHVKKKMFFQDLDKFFFLWKHKKRLEYSLNFDVLKYKICILGHFQN